MTLTLEEVATPLTVGTNVDPNREAFPGFVLIRAETFVFEPVTYSLRHLHSDGDGGEDRVRECARRLYRETEFDGCAGYYIKSGARSSERLGAVADSV